MPKFITPKRLSGRLPRQWQIDVAVGAAILTVGAGGVLTLLVSAGLSDKPVWGACWFIASISVFGLLTLLGAYMLAAVYFPLPLPETRASREARGELQVGEFSLITNAPDHLVIEIPLNVGRLDIANASLNVLVPDFATVQRCRRSGAVFSLPEAEMEHAEVSLYEDGRHQSNRWQESALTLPAHTTVKFYFRLGLSSPLTEPIPLRFQVSAAALHGTVTANTRIV